MNNKFVTQGTAVMLKDAGFSQPEFATGQIWYNLQGAKKAQIGFDYGNGRFNCQSLISGRSDVFYLYHEEKTVFAPTATDILRELGQQYVLWYDDSPKIQMWFCAKTADLPSHAQQPFGHENPAEAAAQAFLNKQKQQ